MTEQSPEAKAFAYAESLGVNSEWEAAKAAREELSNKMQSLHACKSRKRELESLKVDVEMEVTDELRRQRPDDSVAAFDRQLKVEFGNSGPLREIRDELVALQGEIEMFEYEVTLLKTSIEIAVARLHELGGMLQFMAVLKGLSAAKQSQPKRAEGDPW